NLLLRGDDGPCASLHSSVGTVSGGGRSYALRSCEESRFQGRTREKRICSQHFYSPRPQTPGEIWLVGHGHAGRSGGRRAGARARPHGALIARIPETPRVCLKIHTGPISGPAPIVPRSDTLYRGGVVQIIL